MSDGGGISVFLCGRTKTQCFACANASETRCAHDGCGRPLCGTHTRRVGDQDRCSKHAPMATNPNMPKPPGRR